MKRRQTIEAQNQIAEVDLKSMTLAAEFTTGKNPDGMAWVPAK